MRKTGPRSIEAGTNDLLHEKMQCGVCRCNVQVVHPAAVCSAMRVLERCSREMGKQCGRTVVQVSRDAPR